MSIKKTIKSKAGSTMVELIVAFAVLLLAIASWSKIVTVTTDLVRRSVLMHDQRIIFEKCYYLKQTSTDETGTYQMKAGEHHTFVLQQVEESGAAMTGGDSIALPVELEQEKLQRTKEGNTSDIFFIYVAK